MARTELTVNEIDLDSIDLMDLLEAANADGEAVSNDGLTVVAVYNTNASSRTVTIVSTATVDGLAVADQTVTVAQNELRLIGPFKKTTFDQKSGSDKGKIYVNFDAVTDLSVTALRLQR